MPSRRLPFLARRSVTGSKASDWGRSSNSVRAAKLVHLLAAPAPRTLVQCFPAGVDTSGRIFAAIGTAGTTRQRGSDAPEGAPTPAEAAFSAQPSAATHVKNRYMAVQTSGGTSYDAVATTSKNADAIYSSTRQDSEAPVSGFVLHNRLFLDPSGTICESKTGSTLVQSSADAVFEAAYAVLVSPGATPQASASLQACIVAGHVLLGVSAADASALSWHILVDAMGTNTGSSRGISLAGISSGRVRLASDETASATGECGHEAS